MPRTKGTGRTLLDLVWPDESQDYVELAKSWGNDAVEIMMSASWKGYRDLIADSLGHIDETEADEELERTISQLLEPYIRTHLSGDEPYYVQHGCYEFATRKPAPAQPPQYDLAFVLIENRKVMWPMEAKVLRTDRRLARYLRDITQEFLKGRYAPFVNGGAMLGYLFEGSSSTALTNIQRQLNCSLDTFRSFDPAVHRVSLHVRKLRRTDFISGDFRCHHLIMAIK